MKKIDVCNIPWFMISIDNRRFNRTCELFEHFDLKKPTKFTGFTFSNMPTAAKIMVANLALVKMAKALEYDAVFIFEDDAYPCDGIKEKLQDISEVPDDCKVLDLGWIKNSNPPSKEQFVRPNGNHMFGEHSYVVFKDGYEDFENYFKTTNINADWIFWHPIPGIYYYKENLFVQYNAEESNSMHYGYIYGDGFGHDDPPEGYTKIENILNK